MFKHNCTKCGVVFIGERWDKHCFSCDKEAVRKECQYCGCPTPESPAIVSFTCIPCNEVKNA